MRLRFGQVLLARTSLLLLLSCTEQQCARSGANEWD